MKQNITLETADLCSIIALCETVGMMLSEKETFQRIAFDLRTQTGLD